MYKKRSNVPDYVLEDLAGVFLPMIRAFYETEEGKQLQKETNEVKEGKNTNEKEQQSDCSGKAE